MTHGQCVPRLLKWRNWALPSRHAEAEAMKSAPPEFCLGEGQTRLERQCYAVAKLMLKEVHNQYSKYLCDKLLLAHSANYDMHQGRLRHINDGANAP